MGSGCRPRLLDVVDCSHLQYIQGCKEAYGNPFGNFKSNSVLQSAAVCGFPLLLICTLLTLVSKDTDLYSKPRKYQAVSTPKRPVSLQCCEVLVQIDIAGSVY